MRTFFLGSGLAVVCLVACSEEGATSSGSTRTCENEPLDCIDGHYVTDADGCLRCVPDNADYVGGGGGMGGSGGGGSGGAPACGALVELTEWPDSGYVIHFETVGEHAHLWVNSTDGVAHVAAWLGDTTQSIGIPGAPIELDSQYNPGYSYRLDPTIVSFADAWTEVCDATACMVEADPARWLQSVMTWCPWSFQPVEVWDCTQGGDCPLVYP